MSVVAECLTDFECIKPEGKVWLGGVEIYRSRYEIQYFRLQG